MMATTFEGNNSEFASMGRQDAPIPIASVQRCCHCGVLRDSKWFYFGTGPTGLDRRCRPCHSLMELRKREKGQREWHLKQLPVEKACHSCKETLSRNSFSKLINARDGLTRDCKICRDKSAKALHVDRMNLFDGQPPVAAVTGQDRICTECQVVVPRSQFHMGRRFSEGITNVCKKCSHANRTQLRKSLRHRRDAVAS